MKKTICVCEGRPAHSVSQPGRFLSAQWPGLWALGLVLFCDTWLVGAPSGGGSWPTWRGPGGLGVAPDAQPPIEWSETKNVKWKVKIPGSGSRGLHCDDLDGKQQWSQDFGDQRIIMSFGEGSSPALYRDTVIVNWDHEGGSFIVALDKRTGQERWRKPREEKTSWATPLVVEHEGKPFIVKAENEGPQYRDPFTMESAHGFRKVNFEVPCFLHALLQSLLDRLESDQKSTHPERRIILNNSKSSAKETGP